MENKYLQELAPIYAAPDLILPREKLFRFDSPASRYYFRFPDEQTEIAYMGATGATDKLLGTSEALIRWYAKNGELAYLMAKIAADYGTLMHITIGDFEKNGRTLDFGHLENLAFQEAMEGGFPFAAGDWSYFLPRNLASWIQFCDEHEVQVLAVEFPIWSDRFKVATLSDIYCEMTFNRKRVKAIINLKKGYTDSAREDENKTFYESADMQLQIEKLLWKECVPALPLDMVFNWAPNNWKDEPTYTLKNWEKTKFPAETLGRMLPLLQEIPGYFSPPRKVAVLMGTYKPGDKLTDKIKMMRIKRG